MIDPRDYCEDMMGSMKLQPYLDGSGKEYILSESHRYHFFKAQLDKRTTNAMTKFYVLQLDKSQAEIFQVRQQAL